MIPRRRVVVKADLHVRIDAPRRGRDGEIYIAARPWFEQNLAGGADDAGAPVEVVMQSSLSLKFPLMGPDVNNTSPEVHEASL
ncbi:MAG: hypothetical protein ACPL1K_05680, partial [Candidatus Kryptoniota bacterium]